MGNDKPSLAIEPGATVVPGVCGHCHDVWIDAVLSPTWADQVDDRVTFGCRVGTFAGQAGPAAALVAAAYASRHRRRVVATAWYRLAIVNRAVWQIEGVHHTPGDDGTRDG